MQTIPEAATARKMLHDRFDSLLAEVHKRAANPQQLADLDQFVRAQMLALGDEVMRAGVEQAAPTLRNQTCLPDCPKCKKALVFKQHRKTQLRTALTGEAKTVQAPLAICVDCGTTLNLVRHAMRLDADGRTRRLRELAAMAGTLEPYEAAASQVLGELSGITMSANGVHGICQDLGAVAAECMGAGTLGNSRQLKVGEVLYVMADGCMLWIDDGWHEVKFAVIFPSSANTLVSNDRHLTTERMVVATLGDREELGQMVWQAVARWMPPDGPGSVRTQDRIVFISDGSPWLRNMVDEHLPGAFVLLDWYHMAEHVAEAAKILHADNDIGAFQWRKGQESLLMNGRVEVMIDGLRRQKADTSLTAAKREALQDLHGFLDKRRDTLRYCLAKQRGYLIGSGPVESAANHVVQQRMKRSGMRWERDGATAMLALRSAWRSSGGFAALAAAA
jgi:hypothetical protein